MPDGNDNGAAPQSLRAWVEARAAELQELGVHAYIGYDWFEVSPPEISVFGLKPGEMPRLVSIVEAYEGITESAHNDFHGTAPCEEARAALPWVCDNTDDLRAFMRFCVLFGVRKRKSYALYCKMRFWEMRVGVMYFDDDDD